MSDARSCEVTEGNERRSPGLCVFVVERVKDVGYDSSGDYQKQTSPVKAMPSNFCDSSSLEVVNK